EARAYVVFHPESLPNGDNALVVDELAYLDADALFGLFHLFYNLNAQYKSLRWSAPAWLPFSTMFADPYQVRQALDGRHMMMVRVVNVAEALRQMRKPEGRGRFTLAVADPQLTENTGSFTVQYENGLTQVERDLQTNPDLTLSVQALALLVTGSVSWESFRFCHPGYTLHGNADTLAKVFTSRPCLMLNGF
ncbi:MAG: sterol carrier protein domain-containing protein, partial [Clostridia bacterium]